MGSERVCFHGLGRAKLSGASSGFPWPIVHALLCCCLVLFSACCCCFGCFCFCWSCCPLLEILIPCSCMLQQLSKLVPCFYMYELVGLFQDLLLHGFSYSKIVALPVHLLRQVFFEGPGGSFFRVFFQHRFLIVF